MTKAKKLTKETITSLGVSDRGFPAFRAGDTIVVSQRIKEGEKERIQLFEGDVIAMRGRGDAATSFMVRRIGAHSVAVERVFPYYSPLISAIKVVKRGDVRRAKLYYVRDRVGKAARLKEKVLTQAQRAAMAMKAPVTPKPVTPESVAPESVEKEASTKTPKNDS